MKNTWLAIKSQGEIEMNALTLLGASTKRADQTKIGYFGSGLKYTMAVLLRRKIPFVIYQGANKIDIRTEQTEFRGQDFERIVVNGEVTSLTTSMGIDWEPWMAVRETYSNALDEPNCQLINMPDQPTGEAGWTTIGIYLNEDFTDFCEKPGSYFTDFLQAETLLYSSDDGKLYTNGDGDRTIYRKGIRAYYDGKKAMFKYDLANPELTETRTLKYSWSVFQNTIPLMLCKLNDVWLIQHILSNILYCEELNADWNIHYGPAWEEAIEDRTLIVRGQENFVSRFLDKPHWILPESMVTGLKRSFPSIKIAGQSQSGYKYLVVESLTSRQEGILEAAKMFMQDADNPITYNVTVVDFLDKNIMGLAIPGRLKRVGYLEEQQTGEPEILLSRLTLERGLKETVCTLVEEQAHIDSEQADETRGFQDYLIRKYVSALEEKLGRFI